MLGGLLFVGAFSFGACNKHVPPGLDTDQVFWSQALKHLSGAGPTLQGNCVCIYMVLVL